MAANTNDNKREFWWVKNLTSKILTIGDLPKIPSLSPGQRADLLRFASRDLIAQSKDLPSLVKNGWLSLTKSQDSEQSVITGSHVDNAITPAEQNELGDGGGGGGDSGSLENEPDTLVLRGSDGEIYVGDITANTINADSLLVDGSPLVSEDDLDNYLQLSGGTITGDVLFGSGSGERGEAASLNANGNLNLLDGGEGNGNITARGTGSFHNGLSISADSNSTGFFAYNNGNIGSYNNSWSVDASEGTASFGGGGVVIDANGDLNSKQTTYFGHGGPGEHGQFMEIGAAGSIVTQPGAELYMYNSDESIYDASFYVRPAIEEIGGNGWYHNHTVGFILNDTGINVMGGAMKVDKAHAETSFNSKIIARGDGSIEFGVPGDRTTVGATSISSAGEINVGTGIILSPDSNASFANGSVQIDVSGNISANNLSGINTGDHSSYDIKIMLDIFN